MNRKRISWAAFTALTALLFSLVPSFSGLSACYAQAGAQEKSGDWQEVKMEYSTDWNTLADIITPNTDFPPIDDNYVTLPNPNNKEGFRCIAEGASVKLDTKGNGKFDTELKKEGLLLYEPTYSDGGKLQYQVRVWKSGMNYATTPPSPRWYYERGGFMRGQFGGETIIIIDDNNNGCYNDYGKDAIVIGSGVKFAGLLSRTVVIKDKVYELEASANGLTVRFKEVSVPTGKVDVLKGFNFPHHTPGVVVLQNGETYLNIFPKGGAVTAPIGDYELTLALFDKRLRMRKGSFPPIKVEENKETVLKWGSPFKLFLEPRCEKGGSVVTFIPPATLKAPERRTSALDCLFIKMDLPTAVVGAGGEEYFGSPEFKDEKGFCMPDKDLTSFDVAITAKEPAAGVKTAKGKVLNKGVPYWGIDKWIQVDLSGLVQKKPPFWEPPYQCPLYEYRGTVTVKVSTASGVFGPLVFEKDMEVK